MFLVFHYLHNLHFIYRDLKPNLSSLIPKSNETKKGKVFECKFNGDELDGIFNHLRQKLGNNLYNNETIKLSGGGFLNELHPATNLIKYDKENISKYFYNYANSNYPSSESDSWIEFDFGERKINLESYAI